jgi:mRNA interferase MazF
MPYEFGEVVLVRFPFANQTTLKQRPAVIVSGRAYNIAKPDVVIMAITSQVHSSSSLGQVQIGQRQAAGLLRPSVIKPVRGHRLIFKVPAPADDKTRQARAQAAI